MEAKLQTELLLTLLDAVEQDLKPELQTQQASHRADLVEMVLARLAVLIEQGADQGKAPHFKEEIASLQGNQLAAAARSELSQAIAGFSRYEQLKLNDIEARVAELMVDSRESNEPVDNAGISCESFTRYLRQKFPEHANTKVTKTTVIPGGRSKATILVDMKTENGEDSLVIRRDFGANATGVSVTYEFPIITSLWNAGIPVPQPRWLEEDVSVLGGAFIAFSRVPGSPMGTLFSSDVAPEFARDFAATLARLHNIDIQKTGIATTLNWGLDANPVKAMVDHFYNRYQLEVSPAPLMEAAFAWLYLQMETIDFRVGLVHGDAGFHNALGENNHLTGLLDWEFAHCGDPAEDITYIKQQIEQIMPWERFLEAYYQQGGQLITEQREKFFIIWRSVQLGVHMGRAATLYKEGKSRDLRLAAIGFNSFPRVMSELAASLASFAK